MFEDQPLKFFLEYSYENYNLRKGFSYTGGILYHFTKQIGVEGSFSYNQVLQRIYIDDSNDLEDLNSDFEPGLNLSLFLGNLNQLLLFTQYTFDEGTYKIGVFHSFQLADTNKLILGGGFLKVEKADEYFEESPYMVIEFQNHQTYCRLQYTSGLTTEFINSGICDDGPKEISWVLSIGYTF